MANSNNLVNPNAREAMDRFKMEAASEVGVPAPSNTPFPRKTRHADKHTYRAGPHPRVTDAPPPQKVLVFMWNARTFSPGYELCCNTFS